jgi:hypothetical protein
LLSEGCIALHAAPEQQAPALALIQADQPLRVLRSWRSTDGNAWLQVQTAEQRGWLAVA